MNFGGSGGESGGNIKNMWLGYTGIKPLRFQIGAIQVHDLGRYHQFE